MITAKEARHLTLTAADEETRIQSLIEDKARRGLYELYYGQRISPKMEETLILNGFTVEHKSVTTTFISWEEEYY